MQHSNNRISQLGSDLSERIDKAGASASALAVLHPLDFDPDHRFMLSAGLGHYKTRTGVAVDAFWYPVESGNVLLSAGYSSSGSDDHLFNFGATYRFGGDFRHAVDYRQVALDAKNRSNDLQAQLSASRTREENMAKDLQAARDHSNQLESELTAVKAQLSKLAA